MPDVVESHVLLQRLLRTGNDRRVVTEQETAEGGNERNTNDVGVISHGEY